MCCATGKSKDEAQTEYIACVPVASLSHRCFDLRGNVGYGVLPVVSDTRVQIRLRSTYGIVSHPCSSRWVRV